MLLILRVQKYVSAQNEASATITITKSSNVHFSLPSGSCAILRKVKDFEQSTADYEGYAAFGSSVVAMRFDACQLILGRQRKPIADVSKQGGTMAAATPNQQPTPERFFNAINAYEQTEAMKAAVELELFTAIAEGNHTVDTIAKRCHASERGVRILCDFLTIHGFLTKEEAKYALAPDSALFLNQHSPAYIGGAIEFLLTSRVREGHARLTEAVRRGGTALGEGTLEPENPDWVKFAEAMMPLMHMPAETMAGELRKGGEAHKVLDIAAGHGIFGISVAKQNPTAHIYASDWKNVLEVAKNNAQKMGVANRYHLLPGSAFDTDFGGDYDLVLITNFLHHFDLPTCTSFMRKVHGALKPGGRAAIAELVPNVDRVTPSTAAAFSMMMLATTPTGDAYTFQELESISTSAGFSRAELAPPEIGLDRLVIAYR
jgi:2-polyprenyl-3-methyl-5-hydroxy-6-metoxy-1,4-benzoquinol methylase